MLSHVSGFIVKQSKMERGSAQILGDLKVGDRFCFIADRKKEVVSVITHKKGFFTHYVKRGRTGVTSDFYKQVIFLRSNGL